MTDEVIEKRQASNRRRDDTVTRYEFNAFQQESRRFRCEQGKKVDSIHRALFAEDSDNEHKQPGLMHTARRIEQHISAVCNMVKWARNTVIFVAGLVAAGKAAGWW